jgi:hypothetical protein
MRIEFFTGTSLVLLFVHSAGVAAQDPEIAQLRSSLAELRSEYDARITDLENRLAVAEQNALQANNVAQQAVVTPARPDSGGGSTAAFNPAIGLIFQGQAWNYSQNPDAHLIPGFPLGGEAGRVAEGLGLGETELIMNANVDDKFSAWLTVAFALENGESVIEIEEAWVEATALPAGFGARFGRFFSGIGYLNSKHSHSWDFADQPLPYQAFLANQYIDTGLQVRWLAPTNLYMEFGGEVFEGDRYPSAGRANSGVGSYSAFANFGADIGTSSSWLAGVSYLDASAIERPSGDEENPFLFSGDSDLLTTQFVWKWAPNGNWKQRNLVVQAEYLKRSERGEYASISMAPIAYDVDQNGWYLQAVYQPLPRWRVGGRFDTLSSDDTGLAFAGTPLAIGGSDPRRFSFMADWSNSEFSRLRLQFTRDDSGFVAGNHWGLQYIHSIGAHGAHAF